ncbi:hypothetical protein MNBD_GAMMA06-1508 [hydrothermal vent metagenome]|uniref:DUF3179 domain-containing protein n=1 Tax=hydrothermal vent metagenome TaxID=652676 RepID=A0A3B0XHD0_9ZZZZ
MFYIINSLKIFLLIFVLLSASVASAKEINGFELNNALIPPTQIFSGGPDKDGIPSIDEPKFIKARDAGFVKNKDRVLGITIDGVSKAYPISILNWHEIVNDSIGDVFFTITYCPLCGTGMAFGSNVNGKILSFGVSGLLYNSDVLLYDRDTESLWSQLLSKAVTGKYKGTNLKMLPVMHTSWADWKRFHPSTLVLSKNTGHWRSYSRDPYSGYEKSNHIFFPVFNKAPKKYHPKERVLGLSLEKTHKAYPFVELNKHGEDKFTDVIDGEPYTIHWNKKEQSGYLTDEAGVVIPTVQSYWFAWYAFYPETKVFSGME